MFAICRLLMGLVQRKYVGRKQDCRDSPACVLGPKLGYRLLDLFLGLVRVAEEAGLVRAFARLARPVLRRLFPDVPPDHPAMGSILMNVSANVLGAGNAATPFGVKAMQALEARNPHPGIATDAQALFCALTESPTRRRSNPPCRCHK